MLEKEEIKNNPWKVYLAAQNRLTTLGSPKFYIEIELTNDKDNNIFFFEDSFFRWTKRDNIWKKPNIERRFQKYKGQGHRAFEELVPNFGKVFVNFIDERDYLLALSGSDFLHKKIKTFDSYEEFLDEITSDRKGGEIRWKK